MRTIFRICLGVMILLSAGSCSKQATPSATTKKSAKEFDAAAFNYVFVEAIKQKLLGNAGDALNYFEQSVKINPLCDAAYYEMAQIVIANGDLNTGKRYAKKALSMDKENYWYLMMLAGIYYQDHNIDSTIVCYQEAVKYFPDNENLELTLGDLYSENKNYEKAQSIFDSFDREYGVNEKSTVSSIRNYMAEGKYDAALVKAKSLLREYPDEILYNGLLAEIYRGLGENENALDVYEQAA